MAGAGTFGGQTFFFDTASEESATILADAGNPLGTPGGGGQIIFRDNANGGTATLASTAKARSTSPARRGQW